ncbi:MAG TPA: malic enzyme-like NAD(P)-binding protein, partial [Candidatus Atribacteria bacterium]|nr:malic enzyme-like NAD(P)-binding protein [Candidatus Atribacteria bacterium]
FPNQVNNSLGFPGILKGALLVRAKKISDGMAIAASYSLANYAEKRGIHPDNILPTMDEVGVFPQEARDVAQEAIRENLARVKISGEEAFSRAERDIKYARELVEVMMSEGFIPPPPESLLQDALDWAIQQICKE